MDCLHTLPWGIGSAVAIEMMADEKIVNAIVFMLSFCKEGNFKSLGE